MNRVSFTQNCNPFLLLPFLVFITTLTSGQDYRSYLTKADRFAAKGDYVNAIENYLSAERLNPGNPEVYYSLGKAYLISHTKDQAVTYLEKVHAIKPNFNSEINYYLGEAYQYTHQYAKAKKQYEIFKEKNKRLASVVDFKIKECALGDSLVKIPKHVQIVNVGSGINSVFDDYSPLITADGTKFIFTSNRKSANEEAAKRGSSVNYEDIYIANHNTVHWTTPEKISPNINIPFHDAAASISPDGKTLFLYYEQGAGDLYVSTHDGENWSVAKALNKNINTTYWETSGCISADGNKLYFTSNRPGGSGELDIYISQRDANGEWGKAVNLGPNINTAGNEDAPFIHPDGNTLYFGSDGRVGLGEHDIFKSEFKDGKFQPAENLGYPINSAEYENFFVISADNKTAYLSSSRKDCIGNTDIYKVIFLDPETPLEDETKPVVAQDSTVNHVQPKNDDYIAPIVQAQKDKKNVTVLKGKVIDANNTQPLEARITLIDNETNVILSRISSDPVTGDFEITIPHGGNYGVATELNGYLFNSINFNLPDFSEYMELDTHILMLKAEVGSKAVLKNIFFDSGKSDLKTQSISELENLRELLATNTEMKIQINGHTDNVGKPASNKTLSLKRAQAVVEHLIQHGVAPSRLSAVGFGSEKPIVSNDDETQGREINRRTEIEIIESIPVKK